MDFNLLFPLLIVFMIGMIFFSNRQRKKQQQQQESLQNSVSVGDIVVMTCGVSGTVVDTDDERTIDLEIAPEVITTWLRAAVREKLSTDADYVPDTHDEPADRAHHDDDAVPTAFTDGSLGRGANGSGTHGSTTNGATTNGDTVTSASAKDGGSDDDGFADPTASPSSNGVSAGSNTPGDSRSSS